MNSTFKYWDVSGQVAGNLIASGLDKVVFVAGNNIAISTNPKTTDETNNLLTITTVNVVDTTTEQTITGNKTFANDTIINGNLIVNQDASFNSRILVGSDVSLGGRLFVEGDSNINGNLTIKGTLNVQEIRNENITNTTTTTITNYELLIAEDISLNGRLLVSGNTVFNGTVTGITSEMVGLGNVDNSLNLKASTEYVDNSLNLKAAIDSPTFTGKATI
jgi:predicted acyltransferase (DUF342 family)